ncbi:IclR family transcriptional regulator domain-containing protein [Bordetella petrii]|uniref:IclR family transcriptional regulator domain-containing protein n=1 Tax=Bordetella petrii TaxID=94624 RepID=UPI001E4563BC|nr:helix-turn-helix domain-containing protein [Bordetella petrii]MCD0503114.1 helix-turn-helix domain-containing protein [Bordetella petrii]
MGSYEPVVALMRGLDILRCLNEQGPATVGQLHAHTGIAKPTVVRVLETLVHIGYVQRCDDDRKYTVTAKVLTLANGYDAQTQLLAVASPILDAQRQTVGWPIELGVFDHDAMVILNTSRKAGVLAINRKPGSRVPVLRTALGRAYLAALSPALLDEQLLKLAGQAGPDFDLARNTTELADILAQARERGYAVADTETLSNGRALASAIMHNGAPIASVNIVVHTSAMSRTELEQHFGGAIRTIASDISNAL